MMTMRSLTEDDMLAILSRCVLSVEEVSLAWRVTWFTIKGECVSYNLSEEIATEFDTGRDKWLLVINDVIVVESNQYGALLRLKSIIDNACAAVYTPHCFRIDIIKKQE